jgi:hypothetical protein
MTPQEKSELWLELLVIPASSTKRPDLYKNICIDIAASFNEFNDIELSAASGRNQN